MSLAVGFLDLLEGGVGIDLRGSKAAMPEQVLNGADVGAVVEHSGGKGVSEHVGRVLLERRDLSHPIPDYGINGSGIHRHDCSVASHGGKQMVVGRLETVAYLLIRFDIGHQSFADRYYTFLAALTEHAYLPLFEVDIAIGESHQFGATHTGLV